MGIMASGVKTAKKAYSAIHGAATKPRPAPQQVTPKEFGLRPVAPSGRPGFKDMIRSNIEQQRSSEAAIEAAAMNGAAPPQRRKSAVHSDSAINPMRGLVHTAPDQSQDKEQPRFSPEQVASMEDRIGAAGGRRIGGRGAKPGATYRQGEFKGMTAGQAWSRMAGEGAGTPDPNSTGGRSAPYSASNGTMGTGKWALDQRPKTRLAADLGLVGDGQSVPSSAAMTPGTRASAVQEFRNSPAVVDKDRFQHGLVVERIPGKPGVQGAQSRLFGATTGQPPVQATPGASTAPPMDPAGDFKRFLTSLAVPGGPTAPATPAAPAATAKAPTASASPKKRPA